MEAYDISEAHEVTSDPDLTVSLFNRSIDWDDVHMTEARIFADLTILSAGLVLNFVILLATLTKKRLHTPVGCYVLSLTISNLVVLVNVVDDVIRHWFAFELELDLDFVGRVTLQSSALTLVVFSLDRHIALCRVPTRWQKTATKFSTGVKAILLIWSFASISTGMELNLYLHLRHRTVINIFCWSTALYLLMPTFVIAFLNGFIVLEFAEYRGLARSGKDLDGLRLLAGLVLSFYVTMVPQRVVTILHYKAPQICCSPLTMNVCYYLAKVSSIVGPIICLGTLKPLQRSVQEIFLWTTLTSPRSTPTKTSPRFH